ncbi:cadherin repeat domain-containing protein [Olleya namhaensis]|uniref:cadherin repeat domain-containing protein n=1 Tax=Olleya namhaensis TaxID=1144750 RepID=UPI00248F5239|nr:cadherin repeat domain-containing protein [Olleya namhaensis]
MEDNITYSLISQNPEGGLIINPETGDLTVNNNTLFDFETNPVFNAVYVNGSFLEGNINIQLNNVVSSAFVIAGNCPSASLTLAPYDLYNTVDLNQDGQPDLQIYFESFFSNNANLILKVTTLNSNVEITKSEDYKNFVLSELQNPVFDHPAWQGDDVYIHNAANVNWTDKFNEGDVIDTNNDWSGGEFYFNIYNKSDAASTESLSVTEYGYSNSQPYVGLRIITNDGVKYGWINQFYFQSDISPVSVIIKICFDNE